MRVLTPAASINPPIQDSSQHNASKKADLTTGAVSANRTPSMSAVTTPTVPTMWLDDNVVSHNMAAKLCIGFLGHVLFLKNQVPLPIVQLARMSTNDNTSRTAKKRQELLNSFDTLASHMYTTFVALSTALALRGSSDMVQTGMGTESTSVLRDHTAKEGMAIVFFACALGPTVGTAKSRVIVGIDALETKVWGLREDDAIRNVSQEEIDGETDDGASASGADNEDEDESQGKESEDRSEEGEGSTSDDDEYDEASPPPSRSPSPAHSSDSDSSPSESLPNLRSPLVPFEDPEIARAAERLLSRTLANACAEDDGQGLASEMAPTQIHVLLRAPRRFDHPSWIPRQNLCASLDNSLDNFLVGSGQPPASESRKRTKADRVHGVWIKSRGRSAGVQIETQDSEQDLVEEDEMIWWNWDGKLVGLSDC